ncbi:MAG: DedA family protein [Deltaproteobacteria bacterium]
MSPAQLAHWLAPAAYPAIALLLLGLGVGLPFSEDLLLLAAGYLAGRGSVNLYGIMALSYPCVVAGDLMLYVIGRKLGDKAEESPRLSGMLTPKRKAWIERQFARWGVATVAVARQLIGLRSPTFVLAGAARMAPWKFIVTDGLAALVTVPGFILLGYLGGSTITSIQRQVHWIELALLGAVLLAAVAVGLWRLLAKRPRLGTARRPLKV